MSEKQQVGTRQPGFRTRRVVAQRRIRRGESALNHLLVGELARMRPAPVGEHGVRVATASERVRHCGVEPVRGLELVDRARHTHGVSLRELEVPSEVVVVRLGVHGRDRDQCRTVARAQTAARM